MESKGVFNIEESWTIFLAQDGYYKIYKNCLLTLLQLPFPAPQAYIETITETGNTPSFVYCGGFVHHFLLSVQENVFAGYNLFLDLVVKFSLLINVSIFKRVLDNIYLYNENQDRMLKL